MKADSKIPQHIADANDLIRKAMHKCKNLYPYNKLQHIRMYLIWTYMYKD
jgi:hypothetical protein